MFIIYKLFYLRVEKITKNNEFSWRILYFLCIGFTVCHLFLSRLFRQKKIICTEDNWLIPPKSCENWMNLKNIVCFRSEILYASNSSRRYGLTNSSKLYFFACYVCKRTDKATKQIRRARREATDTICIELHSRWNRWKV